MTPFIHLRVHSSYSLAEGAIHPKALVKLCVKNDMPAVAVTDTNNLFGALEFALAAADAGVQPIIGCQISLHRETDGKTPKAPDKIVLLAQTEAGYRNLMALSSKAFLDSVGLSEPQIPLSALEGASDGLILLTGGPEGPVGRLIADGHPDAAEALLLRLRDLFPGRLYVELQRHGLPVESRIEPTLIDLAYRHDLPLVATNDCFFADEAMYEAHDALLCIAQGTVVMETNRRRVTPDHRFKSSAEMRLLFADLPEAVDNTAVIAKRCAIMPKKVKPILPPFATAGGRSEEEELKAQAREGLERRITALGLEAEAEAYRARLEFELGVIIQMGFPGYFLITSDFIKWAKAHDIPVGPGRGSGAGSLVAWALTITDINPIPFGLLFERFLNPERVSMPDFDVDFCQDRREEVIAYVQQRYGADRVAQIITFGKLQARAVLRDVGRVLGFAWGRVDKICKLVPNNPAKPVTLAQAIEGEPLLQQMIAAEEGNDRLVEIATKLEGLYRHASTHAAGVVIGDRPIPELVPLFRDPRSTLPATQFNMKMVELAGLVKYDFLGLKTITVIKRCLDLVKAQDGVMVDLDHLPLDDPKTYALLAKADTVGVFQVESAGMRDALRRIKPDRFEDIIALVALYRPGPMANIPVYADVKSGAAQPEYPHPMLEPILKETYGIMVYQEQVMEIGKVMAGYSLGGADLLRRAMGKKIKAEMDAQRGIFIEGAQKNGVSEADATHVFDLMAKFADYGFNKSHAAAYALISYQTAYLKANHPVEFMAASMTYDMGNTDKLAIFRQEVERMGIRLLLPDVTASERDFAVERLPGGGKAIRYALAAIKGVGGAAMQALVADRRASVPFRDLADFFRRVDYRSANKKTLESLIKAGALDTLHPNRAQLLDGLETLMGFGQKMQEEQASGQTSLFGGGADATAPPLPKVPAWDAMTKLQAEFSAIGFFLSAHPLDQFKVILGRLEVVPSADLARRARLSDRTRFRVAGVVLAVSLKKSKNGNSFAFVQLSDSSGVIEMTVFSEVLAAGRDQLVVGKRVLASVDVQTQEEGIRLTCFGLESLDDALDRMQSGLVIRLDTADGLPDLHAALDRAKGGAQTVSLVIGLPSPPRDVDIRLPGGFTLSQEAQHALYAIPGVAGVQSF